MNLKYFRSSRAVQFEAVEVPKFPNFRQRTCHRAGSGSTLGAHMVLARREFLHLVAGAATVPALSSSASAQACRARPVRTMVGFPPQPTGNLMLKCYLQGWAEANSAKILAATAPGYRFRDPFVGSFFHSTLHEYFDLLQDRLSRAGIIRRTDVVFFLSGPVDRPAHARKLQLWREAPAVGLCGVSEIEFGQQGVIAESVAYDLNLASDTLLHTL
jgi:hypothetical protein